MRTLVIGRSPYADVVIADPSVASHHAELVVTDDGRLYLTGGASETGTWRHEGSADGGFTRVRQAFVDADEPLRLGDYRTTAGELLRAARAMAHPEAARPAGTFDDVPGPSPRLRGRVERDAVTGEIVRRRL